MVLSTTLRPSIVEKNFAAPTMLDTLAAKNFIRKTGGFFPEQQTFLGASIRSFNMSNGKGSTPATLSVELVVDPGGTNPTPDDLNKVRGVYDPYHHNKTGDAFSPPAVGMPVFFVYSNPRVTIKEAFDPNYPVLSHHSVIKFGGILQSFHGTNSIGGRTFSVSVSDPREILSNIYLILNHADEKVGERENNVFNVFGFLEYNATQLTKDKFKSYTNNCFRRSPDGSSVGGDDMFYKTFPKTNQNDINFTGYFTNTGHTQQFPITGTGMSRRSSYGIPYYRVMQALAAMNSSLPDDEYSGFSGNILFRGLKYQIHFANLPPLHPMYYFDHDNIDLLSFLIEASESCGFEINVSLEPVFSNDLIGGKIVVSFIDRSNESAVGQIRSFINDKRNFPQFSYKMNSGKVVSESIIEKEDIGYEMANPQTSKIVFGGNRVDLYAFTSNHDDGRWGAAGFGGGSSQSNQILPFYGLLKDNVVVPTKGKGEWTQILLDSSGLGAFGVGDYYVATEAELRYALKGFKSWKKFMEFYNNRWLQELHTDIFKYKYIDEYAKALVLDKYGYKVPRCLFTTNAGFQQVGGDWFFKNPCCPGYGYPLYYNRAIAIGLTVKKVIDDRYSVVSDLRILKALGDGVQLQRVINAILTKYKTISHFRKLSAAEWDLLKVLKSQTSGLDGKYIDSIISNLNGQMAVPIKNQATRSENAQKVFGFVKNVAEECYGKKWLVRIPTKPNFKFESTDKIGIDLSANKYCYTKGYFGFKPMKNKASASAAAACPQQQSFVYNSNQALENTDPAEKKAQSLFKPALVTNYNPIDDDIISNYTPNDAGGFVTQSMYSNALKTALIPEDLNSFGSEHRIKAYVRYDHAEKLNITSAGSQCYTEYVGTDINRKKSIPHKTLSYDLFDAKTTSGTMLAFMPVSLDSKFYYPASTQSRLVPTHGAYKLKYHPVTEPIKLDASGNVPSTAGTYTNTIIDVEAPVYSTGQQNIQDFPRDKYGKIKVYPNTAEAYALITSPSLVGLKIEKLSDMPKSSSYKVATYPGYFNDPIAYVTKIKVQKKLDFEDFGAQVGFYNPFSVFAAPLAVKPDIVVLPLENEQACYGPWYNGPIRYKDANNQYKWKTMKDLGGKVEIQNDESLCPWNFGSYELMNIAGESRVQLANTLYLASEKGSVSYPGLPMGKTNIGDLISLSGPIVDSISIDVSSEGVRTSYRFQTYSRSFANVQKQQEHKINMLKMSALKASKNSFDLAHRGMVKRKFKGNAPPPTAARKPYTSVVDPYYVNPALITTNSSTVIHSPPANDPTAMSKAETSIASVNSSSEARQEYYNQDDNFFGQARDHLNTAETNISETQIAVSKNSHHLLPSMDIISQEDRESLYTSFTDPYKLDVNKITHWG
jgi:hypothetical protein